MNPGNFLSNAKRITPGDGFVRRVPIPLAALNLGTNVAIAADETNGLVAHVTEGNDIVFNQDFAIPYDYDEAKDHLKVRVLVAQLTVSSDTTVEVDMAVYKKTAGSALGSDLNPTAPGTVMSVTEVWEEFDLSGNGFVADDIAILKLITNGANNTNAEELQLHAVQVEYKTCLVAYDTADRS